MDVDLAGLRNELEGLTKTHPPKGAVPLWKRLLCHEYCGRISMRELARKLDLTEPQVGYYGRRWRPPEEVQPDD